MTATEIPAARSPEERPKCLVTSQDEVSVACLSVKCPTCEEREQAERVKRNRWITAGQAAVCTVQASLAGVGVWHFFADSEWLAAGAAAGLAGLGYGAVKGLSKLRPKP
ncbi:hypothetical protein ACIRQQ_38570 [Streptomyces fuscichromogenes]|uniref:hypothetical protein n=1 Tax=Streptomyces fuscichromogenes TaxID=1324013 RepID=UPI0038249657